MSKKISVFFCFVVFLICLVSCDGTVNEKMYNTDHNHIYTKVMDDGSWECKYVGCHDVLESTKGAYFAVVEDGEIAEIQPLTDDYEAGEIDGLIFSKNYISFANNTDAKTIFIKTSEKQILSVDAPKSSVYHYGKANTVLLKAVANNSYHLSGEVKDLVVKEGNIVLNSGAKVEDLSVAKTASAGGANVTIHKNNDASIGVLAVYENQTSVSINDTAVGTLGVQGVSSLVDEGYVSIPSDALYRVKTETSSALPSTTEKIRVVNDVTYNTADVEASNMVVSVDVTVTVKDSGSVSVSNGGTLSNFGTIDNEKAVTNSGSVMNFGVIETSGSNSSLTNNESSTIENFGTLSATNSGKIDNKGKVEDSGTITVTNGTITNTGKIETTEASSETSNVYEAQIGSAKYLTLSDAIKAVSNTQTLVLLKDITASGWIEIKKPGIGFTFDIAGYKVERNDGSIFDIYSKVSFIDSLGTGEVKAHGRTFYCNSGSDVSITGVKITGTDGNVINVIGDYGTDKKATLVINDCTVKCVSAVNVQPEKYGAELTINGGTITSEAEGIAYHGGNADNSPKIEINNVAINASGTAISGNGSKRGAFVKINGGFYTSKNSCAIYHPEKGSMTITGGTFTGTEAIVVKSGNVEIKNGTFVSKGTQIDPTSASNSGYSQTGDCIYVEDNYDNSDYGFKHDIELTIQGGSFTSNNGHALSARFSNESKGAVIEINGGSYSSALDALYDSNSFGGTITVCDGQFSSNPAKYVVSGYYASYDNGKYKIKEAPEGWSVWNGIIPDSKPESLVYDKTNRTITVNDASAFAYLYNGTKVIDDIKSYESPSLFNTERWVIVLNNNIDLNNEIIGQLQLYFSFDGCKKTIRNVILSNGVSAFFSEKENGDTGNGYIKDLTIDTITVNSSTGAGAFQHFNNLDITNCHVKNAKISGVGDSVGGLVGFSYGDITDCSVEDSEIIGSKRRVGSITGWVAFGTVSNCSAKNNVLDCGAEKEIGGICGRFYYQPSGNDDQYLGVVNCRVENITIKVQGVKQTPQYNVANSEKVGKVVGRTYQDSSPQGNDSVYEFKQTNETKEADCTISNNTVI